MGSNNDGGRPWGDLPKEILETMGRRLDSRVDVYRFRAVCSSWRSSVPASYRRPPLQSIKLPEAINADAFFSQVTICRLHSVDHQPISLRKETESPSSSSSTTWNQASRLTKVEESIQGEMQLLIPLSNRQLNTSLCTPLKLANLLEFRLVEVEKAYTLKLARGRSVYGINKVVLHPIHSASWVDVDNSGDFGLLVIYQEGKLGYWRFGDDKWTLVDEQNFHYDDITIYKGQFYVVDRGGTISWIDSSLKLVQYSPPLFGCGNKKNLVESCGDLYVVDRYLDGEWRMWSDAHMIRAFNSDLHYLSRRNYPVCRAKTVDIKVYKLDEEWGTWVDMSSLGDRVFVLGNECCFSVSAKDFPGCGGNCVYFTDPVDVQSNGELSGYSTRVFKLSDRSIARASSLVGESPLFWPPLV